MATTKPADQATSPLIVTPVTSDELANMAYSGIYDIAVTLKDGRWEGDRVQLHNGRISTYRLSPPLFLDGFYDCRIHFIDIHTVLSSLQKMQK